MIKVEIKSQKDVNVAIANVRMAGIDILESRIYYGKDCNILEIMLRPQDEMLYRLMT